MRFDHQLTLIGEGIVNDEIGNQLTVETKRNVFCEWKSAGSKEFYSASVAGMRPERIFKIYFFEYNDEQKVEFKGIKYTVIRTYRRNAKEIELVCQRIGADVQH